MKYLVFGALLVAAPAAQAANVYVHFGQPPPLVEVQPGVHIVPDIQEEVYYVDGAYWHFANGRWYRAYDYRGDWAPVRTAYVPRPIYVHPRHHYGPRYYAPRPVVQRAAPPRGHYYYAPPRGHARGHYHHDRDRHGHR